MFAFVFCQGLSSIAVAMLSVNEINSYVLVRHTKTQANTLRRPMMVEIFSLSLFRCFWAMVQWRP